MTFLSTSFRPVKLLLFTLGAVFFMSGCNKDICDECLTKTGDDVRSDRPAAPFTQINLESKVDLVLTQDTVEHIAVVAGKNLIDKVETSVNGGILTIHNHNTCNFVRSYSRRITVYVSVHHLQQLLYNGAGDVTCTNTIQDSLFSINSTEGSGSVHLSVNALVTNVTLTSGPPDLYIYGSSPLVYIYSSGNGTIHSEGLTTPQVYLTNNGTGDLFVSSTNFIEAKLGNSGNVFCSGHPGTILKTETGSGRFSLQ